MTWSSSNGTKTATVPSTCTFTNSSANIGVTNTCAAGDMVVFSTTSALPTNFTAGTTYYVLSSSLSTSNIQVAATSGGSAISAGSAGSGTQTGTFEHVLAQDTSDNATFQYELDCSNMALIDLVKARIYAQDQGSSTYVLAWSGCWQDVQAAPLKESPFQPSDVGIQVTLAQLAGTGRAFNWKLRHQ